MKYIPLMIASFFLSNVSFAGSPPLMYTSRFTYCERKHTYKHFDALLQANDVSFTYAGMLAVGYCKNQEGAFKITCNGSGYHNEKFILTLDSNPKGESPRFAQLTIVEDGEIKNITIPCGSDRNMNLKELN